MVHASIEEVVRARRAGGTVFRDPRGLDAGLLEQPLLLLVGLCLALPLLFLGSLVTESFFGIPGLGSYTIDAINRQDFAIVRSMVFLGSVLYIVGLVLTDISYTIADPRVRLN